MSPQQQLLQDEARAWREIAERIDGRGYCYGLCSETGNRTMDERIWRHLDVGTCCIVHARDLPGGIAEATQIRVLASLFLALEAEDELKALTPVSRPSSLRRPRQHKRGK